MDPIGQFSVYVGIVRIVDAVVALAPSGRPLGLSLASSSKLQNSPLVMTTDVEMVVCGCMHGQKF